MGQKKRKIAVVIVDRANYGRLKPVMEAMKQEPAIEMQTVVSGTMVLERFGLPSTIVREDGFEIDSEIYIELEGSNPTTMAKSLGFAVIEFAGEFRRLQPDMLLVIGDRYEAFAAMLAASYMNICISHIQGGEVSGSIDESARHCMTKLAHYHFPATVRSAEFIERMGERSENVFHVGCPSGDLALNQKHEIPADFFNSMGSGGQINAKEPYILTVFHPVTTAFGNEKAQTIALLDALADLQMPTVWLWPNIDAGADLISKTIRSERQKHGFEWLRTITNFTPYDYQCVLANATVAVGNSSSFVRDTSFFGTPVILVGDRQRGREYAENVVPVLPDTTAIKTAISNQIGHGRYAVSNLYGDGNASKRIVEKIRSVEIFSQKSLSYVPGHD